MDANAVTAVVSVVIAVISCAVAVLTWTTSASKGYVDNLCKIISAQAERLRAVEAALEKAEAEIVTLRGANEALRLEVEQLREENHTLKRLTNRRAL